MSLGVETCQKCESRFRCPIINNDNLEITNLESFFKRKHPVHLILSKQSFYNICDRDSVLSAIINILNYKKEIPCINHDRTVCIDVGGEVIGGLVGLDTFILYFTPEFVKEVLDVL